MMYLITQMALCLLIAAILGGIVGFLIRHMMAASANAAYESNIAGLESSLASVRADHKTCETSLSQLSKDLHAQKTATAAAEAKLAHFATLEAEADELRTQLGSREADLKRIQNELISMESMKRRIAELQGKTGENTDLAAKLAAATAAAAGAATLRTQLGSMTTQRDKMAREARAVEGLRARVAALEADNKKLAKTAGSGEALKKCQAKGQALAEELAALKATPTTGGGDTDALATERDLWKGRYESLEERSAVDRIKLTELLIASGTAPKPEWLLSSAPTDADDLQLIKGIGPVLSGTLNELGIYKFAQLAQLSASDIAWVSSNIKTFPDRIVRDKWVAQAIDFQRRKENGEVLTKKKKKKS